MSMYKQIVSLTEQGLTPKEIAKRTRAKISYVYFVRNEVKKAGKKKSSKIMKAVKQTKAALDVMEEGTKIGGLTLTKVDDKSYRWVRDDLVNNPPHYTAGGIDFIDFAEAKGLTENAYLFNVVKYVVRAGKKADVDPVQDLEKAEFYLKREIARRKRA
jgi:hypothetical protein